MASLKWSFSKVISLWNKFFFEPISPAALGLFRICFGLVILDALMARYLDRDLLYSDKGLVTSSTIALFFKGVNPHLQFFSLVPTSDPQLGFFILALMIISLCFTLGIFTRVSNVLMFLGLLALDNRNFFAINAGDEIIRINSFFLMFSPAGTAYSIDRWIRVKRKLETASLPLKSPWAQRLIQLQIAYIYLDSVFLKMPGQSWRDGTALYYALNYLELKRFDMKWLFYFLWQIKLATWGSLIVETSMFTLVWFRKCRYWCLLFAFLFHFGINLAMQFPIFQYVMMAGLTLFIYPKDLESALMWTKTRLRSSVA